MVKKIFLIVRDKINFVELLQTINKRKLKNIADLAWDLSTTYEYDSKGRMAKIIVENGNGRLMGLTEYEYDSKGNVTEEFNWNSTKEFKSPRNNLRIVGWTTTYDTAKWTTYEYDSQGNKTEEIYYDSSGVEKERTEYEYNSKGDITKEIYYEKGVEKERIKYYDYTYIKMKIKAKKGKDLPPSFAAKTIF
jgi:YD repeat-containing protein